MRNRLIVLGLAAVLLLLASTVSLAGNRTFNKPNMPDVGLREIYDRSQILRFDEDPVQLPRPIGDVSASGVGAPAAIPGPFATAMEQPDGSSALVQPRGGGSMYSEQQNADREIRRLIRRLN